MKASESDTRVRRIPRWSVQARFLVQTPKLARGIELKSRSHAVTIVDDDPLGPFALLRDVRGDIASHDLLNRIASGTLGGPRLRRALVTLYPMLESYAALNERNYRSVDHRSWTERELARWLRCNLRTVGRYRIRYREFAGLMGVNAGALAASPPDIMKTLLGLVWQGQRRNDNVVSLAMTELGLGWTLGEVAGALVRGYPGHREAFDARFLSESRRDHSREASAHIVRTATNEPAIVKAVVATNRTLQLCKIVLDAFEEMSPVAAQPSLKAS